MVGFVHFHLAGRVSAAGQRLSGSLPMHSRPTRLTGQRLLRPNKRHRIFSHE
jgi:hypothetical protein